jgi:hypothetical protein
MSGTGIVPSVVGMNFESYAHELVESRQRDLRDAGDRHRLAESVRPVRPVRPGLFERVRWAGLALAARRRPAARPARPARPCQEAPCS